MFYPRNQRALKTLFYIFLLLTMAACDLAYNKANFDQNFLIDWNNLSIETMKTDGINPVLATRIYLYPNVAAYEVLAVNTSSLNTLFGKLIDFPEIAEAESEVNVHFSSIVAYYLVMKKLNYREDVLKDLFSIQAEAYQNNLTTDCYHKSLSYGEKVASLIWSWANNDQYKETKAKPYYLSSGLPGSWKPTPPEYRPALEPHWGTLRLLTITHLDSFSIPFEIPYSEEVNSPFYQLAKEVYDSSFLLTENQKSCALFWDDNPDLNNFQGHIPISRRHINPTAHWMSIIGQVLRKESLSVESTAELYAMVSIAFFDANLVCWENKYRYDLIRPVTYIQEQIDPYWKPLLVTPPFPEHTSGHSACSAAAAVVLTHLLGDNYSFTDSTHYDFGLGVRSFNSFEDAAWEVSFSRFYGGIHYLTGVQKGSEQGFKVGDYIVKHMKL